MSDTTNTRKESLLQYIKEDPQAPFNYYALALEYLKEDKEDDALKYFNILLEQHPDYLPTYYHAAALYTEYNMLEEARHTYEKGVDLAYKQQDFHARRELQNAFQNFLFEHDLE
ncbi:hypothetical protein GCM10007049_03470 [Echinicola pacifica]|uniref:Tetratricopeptide repeat-containing protein n=1 Tax=Echinicola pacifica TaxID=346377 RepID=A0A918UIP2_9BACT|nr:hypothetical protein [Echinicola pacifica]GGZ14809.1 hypothetical protein GCM10007049_03470 [Echinicola pacifica]